MYGAILGDIIGSPFEFDRGDKTKNFDLFSEGCGFTDDSVMTIAVGEALLAVGPEAAVKEIEDALASNMQDWGKRYPHAGYGGSFRHWLKEKNPKPYGSYGNGSAMRVSAAGWLYDSIERTREVARATSLVFGILSLFSFVLYFYSANHAPYTYIDVIFLGSLFSFMGIVISIITRKSRKIYPALWISGIISCMLGFIVCMLVFSMLIGGLICGLYMDWN